MLATLKRPLSIALALLALFVPAGAIAVASVGGSPDLAEVVTDIAAQENTNTETNLDFLFAIYMVTWAGFFAYIFIVSRRQGTMEREIKDLRRILEDQSPAGHADTGKG